MQRIFDYINDNPWYMIAMLFLFHVFIASVMAWLSYSPYLATLHNGAGFWKFSIDSTLYHQEAISLLEYLNSGDFNEWWLGYPRHKHVRFIALVYWVFGDTYPLLFELVNSFVWVISVVLIYRATYYLFNQDIKIAVVVSMFMFFPSILISSVQLLREPFYILGFCFITYGLIVIFIRNRSWLGVFCLISGYILLLSTKDYIIPLVLYVFSPWLLISIVARKIDIFPSLVMFLVVAIITFGNDFSDSSYNGAIIGMNSNSNSTTIRTDERHALIRLLDLRIANRLSSMRKDFKYVNNGAGSSIDVDVRYQQIEDVILYFPRAIQISFLSPFPTQWLSKGKQTGRMGMIIAGFETVILYVALIGFIWVLFTNFHLIYALIPILLLSGIIIVLLGYAVPNVGTIYRMRQGLLIPFYMVGVYGVFMMHYYYRMKNND